MPQPCAHVPRGDGSVATLSRSIYAQPATVPGERHDCAVRALMVAACVDYNTAHAACKAAGRADRDGFDTNGYTRAIRALIPEASAMVWEPTKTTLGPSGWRIRVRRPTLAAFIEQHPRGHYVVHVPGHYLAVVDGVVHDWGRWGRTARRTHGQVGAAGEPVRTAGERRGVVGYWKLA